MVCRLPRVRPGDRDLGEGHRCIIVRGTAAAWTCHPSNHDEEKLCRGPLLGWRCGRITCQVVPIYYLPVLHSGCQVRRDVRGDRCQQRLTEFLRGVPPRPMLARWAVLDLNSLRYTTVQLVTMGVDECEKVAGRGHKEVGRYLPEALNTRCVRPSGAVEAPLTSLVQVAHTCLPSSPMSDSEATSIAARALRVHSLTESQHHLRFHYLYVSLLSMPIVMGPSDAVG